MLYCRYKFHSFGYLSILIYFLLRYVLDIYGFYVLIFL